MIGEYLKKEFGEKIVKLSLDGGFTCPNRDGSKGTGGCIFCSADGSGDFAGSIPSQIELLSAKWPRAKYIAYFQNHTNTYAPVSELREKFYAALNYGKGDCACSTDVTGGADCGCTDAAGGAAIRTADCTGCTNSDNADCLGALNNAPCTGANDCDACGERPEIIGLAIATRPDCLNDEIYELLAELNEKTFLWVELGLQSMHDETGKVINRCHPLAVYDEAAERLAALGIRTVTHLIFGLPKSIGADGSVVPETRDEMLASVRHVCRTLPLNKSTSSRHIFGIKLHMLNVVRGSQMERLCPSYVPFSSIGEYTDLVIDALKIIPRDITVHRMSADAPRPILIAPEWSYKKRTILNEIHRKMAERDLYQGQDAE